MLPEKVDTLIVADCILHNLLTRPSDAEQWFWEAGPTQKQRQEDTGNNSTVIYMTSFI